MSTATLHATCLCRLSHFSAPLPSSLPLLASTCHCTSCRHNSGALYTSDVDWPDRTIDLSSLKTYPFSPTTNVHFCPRCGAGMFYSKPGSDEGEEGVWTGVWTGVLSVEGGDEKKGVELLKWKHAIYVKDTVDGGCSAWIDGVGRFVERAVGENVQEIGDDWPDADASKKSGAEGKSEVGVWCKCRGVDFVLHREEWRGGDGEEEKEEDRERRKLYLDPETGKFKASWCACDSCRLSFGIEVVPWMFTDLKNLSMKDGTALPSDMAGLRKGVDEGLPGLRSLAHYSSSPGVERFFCSSCSATVFYAHEDRPRVVDVAVGLLDAGEGARAESLLKWNFGRVGDKKDVEGSWREEFVEGVERRMGEWAKKRDVRGQE
ncbi:Mss4-like protein [Dendryphion nanum]|uniref:Mss4-like protein n=1 Tax=Dendryphion nanum TaxID=256645 RepID=A0A9P9E4P4_9PLEO|nr:Mss4-like protein [Dendryphion nanum]